MAIANGKNQYDYSRLKAYKLCPKKHDYRYVEEIVSKGNQYTEPGRMFHRCVELIRTQPEGFMTDVKQIYGEFDKLCLEGKLPHDTGLLKYIVEAYFVYYKTDHTEETLLMCEEPFEDITGTDVFVGTIDQVYQRDDLTVLRDIKTTANKLKYTYKDVKYNEQLLFYVAFAEDKQPIIIDAIEIDEVRLARLRPVPLLKNGKPSKDKRELELVLLDEYEAEIKAQGLPINEYMSVIDWMTERGHPLFRRIQVQVNDRVLIQTNMSDMVETYNQIKSHNHGFRNVGPLCNYCDYKELCEADRYTPDDSERKIYIDEITGNA